MSELSGRDQIKIYYSYYLVSGWVGGWMDNLLKRITYSNQKLEKYLASFKMAYYIKTKLITF